MSWGSFSFGSAPYGAGVAVQAGSVSPPATHGKTLSFTVAGTDYTNYLLNSALRYTDELGTRNTLEVTLVDTALGIDREIVQVGAPVILTRDGGTLVFAGSVDALRHYVADDISGALIYELRCVDFNQLADRHLVTHSWTDQTLRAIVQDIVNTYSGDTGETLASEGVTTTNTTVQEGPVLEAVKFNYVACSEALDKLAELTGFSWYIDYQKQLQFFERQTFDAPYNLDDSVWQNYRGLSVSTSRGEYRNIQTLRAGTGLAAARTEDFAGDDTTTQWTLKKKVGAAPTILVDSTAQSVGIDTQPGKSEHSTTQWFYEIGEDKIIQNENYVSYTAPLATGSTLHVTYQAQYPIFLEQRDDVEIDERQDVEGGTGTYHLVEQDEDIDDADMARERIAGLLRRYSRIITQVEFQTDSDGFRSGQHLSVDVPDVGVEGSFLIESVSADYVDDTLFRYNIRAIKGEMAGGWADFYKRLAKKGRPLVISDNESIGYIRSSRSQIQVGCTLATSGSLSSYLLDYTRYAIVGLSWIGGKRTDDPTDIAGNYGEGTHDGNIFGPFVGRPYT
jgi:hypothetical protein